ncbi:MAG: hypothetical protein AB1765_02550 [Candidatus Hydrogenedentota bacterium]
MLDKHIIGNILIDLSVDKVKRRLSIKKARLDKEIETAIEEVRTYSQTNVVISEFVIDAITEESIIFNRGKRIESKNIAKLLENSNRIYIFAVTLGIDVDNRIEFYFKNRNESKGLILDAAASEYVEAVVSFTHNFLKNRAKRFQGSITPRFSPGYGDLSLDNQRLILKLAGARKIGIKLLSPSMIMIPRKSVTAICGMDKIFDKDKK